MDWDLVTRVAQLVFTLLMAAVAWGANRHKATLDATRELDARLQRLETRMVASEEVVVKHSDFSELRVDMGVVTERVDNLRGLVEALAERHQETSAYLRMKFG